MGSKQLTADLNFAWPTARIAVIGAEGAAQLLVKRFPDPTAPEVQKIRADFIEGTTQHGDPHIAAERGFIDAVIEPHQTRFAAPVDAVAARQADSARPAQTRPDTDLTDSDSRRNGCAIQPVRRGPLSHATSNAVAETGAAMARPSASSCCTRRPSSPYISRLSEPACGIRGRSRRVLGDATGTTVAAVFAIFEPRAGLRHVGRGRRGEGAAGAAKVYWDQVGDFGRSTSAAPKVWPASAQLGEKIIAETPIAGLPMYAGGGTCRWPMTTRHGRCR